MTVKLNKSSSAVKDFLVVSIHPMPIEIDGNDPLVRMMVVKKRALIVMI